MGDDSDPERDLVAPIVADFFILVSGENTNAPLRRLWVDDSDSSMIFSGTLTANPEESTLPILDRLV